MLYNVIIILLLLIVVIAAEKILMYVQFHIIIGCATLIKVGEMKT